MSATDEQHGQLDTGYPHTLRPELHKALMARGIDYWVTQGITFWNRDDGCECLAYGYKVDGVPKLAIKIVGFTDPEQAIAATLGREPDDAAMVKLHDRMNAALLEYERAQGIGKRDGDEAIVVPWVAKMHSLIEEAATLGAGTCHDTSKWTNVFKCSECGFDYDFVTDPYQGPHFCPNCGRRVVSE